MQEALPYFRYHPDPISTGAIEVSHVICLCCGRARGYIYVGPIYAMDELHESICPWCIADGSVASKFDASFADSHLLIQAGLPQKVIEEIHLRTPAFISWQQEQWLSHCNDGCEFHGHATTKEIRRASAATKNHWMEQYQQDETTWNMVTKEYQPRGNSALYKFVCKNCGMILFGWDLS